MFLQVGLLFFSRDLRTFASMNQYWELFKIFFRIGAFTIGGGYAMVPLIEDEIVNKKKWIPRYLGRQHRYLRGLSSERDEG